MESGLLWLLFPLISPPGRLLFTAILGLLKLQGTSETI